MNELTIRNKDKQVAPSYAVIETEKGRYLTFLVGKNRLGISIRDVKEIIEISNITDIPSTPDYIRGVINLRGGVVPIIDLAARLQQGVSDLGKRSCIVLVDITCESKVKKLGVLVDQVDDILQISEDNIKPGPEFGGNIKTEFIQAMGRVDDNFIILLEISRVLSVSELSQLNKAVELGMVSAD